MSASATACLGYAETQFLSTTAVISDAMLKAANVSLLGLEPNGTEGICIRIGAETPAVLQAALDKAEALDKELGSTASCASIGAPHSALRKMNSGPMVINNLYGGREELRPTDFKTKTNNTMKHSHDSNQTD